jgi:hypothetical protein
MLKEHMHDDHKKKLRIRKKIIGMNGTVQQSTVRIPLVVHMLLKFSPLLSFLVALKMLLSKLIVSHIICLK